MNLGKKIETALNVIVEKKGRDIERLDVSDVTQIADTFLICLAKNRSQSQAIADEIMDRMEDGEERPLRVEGYQAGSWILLDYSDLIIHIFLPEEKEYYNLSRLWKDARFTHYDEDGIPLPVEEESFEEDGDSEA